MVQSPMQQKLKTMYEKYAEDYRAGTGMNILESENWRWHALVFCVVNNFLARKPPGDKPLSQFYTDAQEQSVSIVTALQELNLLEIRFVANAVVDSPNGRELEKNALLLHALRQHLTQEDAIKVVGILSSVAQLWQNSYGGKPQTYLRQWGMQMQREFAQYVSHAGIPYDRLVDIYAQWLQLVLRMPILWNHWTIKEYCAANRVSIDDLYEAADALDLNVFFMDELFSFEAAAADNVNVTEARETVRKMEEIVNNLIAVQDHQS